MVLKKILILALITNLFSSCVDSVDENEKKEEEEKVSRSFIEEEKTITIISEKDGLSIDENCIGCGKCAFVAPENFKMNPQTFTADVISGENVNSAGVQQAINICPTGSISS